MFRYSGHMSFVKTMFCEHFLLLCTWLLYFLMMSFEKQKVSILMKFKLPIFFMIRTSCVLRNDFKVTKIVFSSRNLVLLAFVLEEVLGGPSGVL